MGVWHCTTRPGMSGDKPDEMGALMSDIAGFARFPFWFG
jgi:hypothetical protein